MKILLLLFLKLLLFNTVFTQSANQRSIIVNNEYNADYIDISGVPIKIIPPKNFVLSDSFFGFEHPLTESSIVISSFKTDVNKSFISFNKRNMFRTGFIVESEVFYKINDYDAMLVKGKQSAHGHKYNRILLVVGNSTNTILLNSSFLSSSSERHANKIKKSLLSVIPTLEKEVDPLDRFDFSLDVAGTILQPGEMMLNSMVFTDDGHVPSRSENPVSLMARRSKNIVPLSEADKIRLCERLMELYPIEWYKSEGLNPQKRTLNNLKGFEMYGVGVNRESMKAEMIYQIVWFDEEYYYVITGMAVDNFSNNLRMFRRVAKTLNTKN